MLLLLVVGCGVETFVAGLTRGGGGLDRKDDPVEAPGERPGAAEEAGALPPGTVPAGLLDRYRLGAAVTVDRLTVWPVLDTRPVVGAGAVVLADALTRGLAEVVEKGEGTVPTLTLRNKGDAPVLASAGDVVVGGKQDRILTETVVVAPGATVDVPVNCVEQGRWHASSGQGFGYGGRGELDLRKTVRTEKDQSATWAKVAEKNAEKAKYLPDSAKDALAPSTGTYRASLTNDALAERVGPLVTTVSARLDQDPHTVGFVAAVGESVAGVELYGSAALFDGAQAHAVRSVALDALASESTGAPPTDAVARAALSELLGGAVTRRDKAGAAEVVQTGGARSKGYLVVDEGGELLQALGYVEGAPDRQ